MLRRTFIRQSTVTALGLPFIPLPSFRQREVEVLILGAGLSGLHAAQLLEEQGISYQILEANQRVGGRVYTLDHLQNQPEAGAVEIGNGYKRVVGAAEKLGLNLEKGQGFLGGLYLHINGHGDDAKNWQSHTGNKLPEALKKVPPYLLQGRASQPLIYQHLDDWFSTKNLNLDQPLSDFLTAKDMPQEALRLINHNGNFNEIDQVSTAHCLRASAYRQLGTSTGTLSVTGGNMQLALKMANNLQHSVNLGKAVKGIKAEQNQIKVNCEDGTSFTSRYLISTIPFSVMRDLSLDINFPEVQAMAIKKLGYTNITIALIKPKERFWEQDGLGLNMWTDTAIERVFALHDSEGQPVLFKAFINGRGATNFDELSPKAQEKLILKEFEKIRPSAKGKIEILEIFSWGKNPYSKGAYAEFYAGQVKQFVPHMAAPIGNVFLAGGHTEFIEKGMEGAMASAERAVNELIQKKKKDDG